MAAVSRIRRKWTREEDPTLYVETEIQRMQGSLKDWSAIAAKLPSRTKKDCRKRWSRINKTIKKGPWSEEEDDALREAIRRFGMRWVNVAEAVGGRYADQCARRWQSLVEQSQNESGWTKVKDEELLEAVKFYGSNWNIISEQFPGRTITGTKQRLYMLTEQRALQNTMRSKSPKDHILGSISLKDNWDITANTSMLPSSKAILAPQTFDFQPTQIIPEPHSFFDLSLFTFPDNKIYNLPDAYLFPTPYFNTTETTQEWEAYDFNLPPSPSTNVTDLSDSVTSPAISSIGCLSPRSIVDSSAGQNMIILELTETETKL